MPRHVICIHQKRHLLKPLQCILPTQLITNSKNDLMGHDWACFMKKNILKKPSNKWQNMIIVPNLSEGEMYSLLIYFIAMLHFINLISF